MKAIRDALPKGTAAGPVAVAIGDGAGLRIPFYVVSGSGRNDVRDSTFAGPCDDFRGTVQITCTAPTVTMAHLLAEDAVETLTPGRHPSRLDVPGRFVQLEHFETRGAVLDTTVPQMSTGRHPAYCVVLFDVDSQPLTT